jgi:hypothetical protein
MGSSYQAQVEVFCAANAYRGDVWQAVSRWELGKDYSAAGAWMAVAEKGWPLDVCLIGASDPPDPKWGYDLESKYHVSGKVFALLEPEGASPWFIELREHVTRLLAGYRVRVLTWGE